METQISLRLPVTLLADIDARARRVRTTRSRLIRELLESAMSGGRVAEPEAPYDRVRDLVGSVEGSVGSGGARRAFMISVLRDRRA